MAIFQIHHQRLFSILGIVHRFLEAGSTVGTLLFQPFPECIEYWFFFLQTVCLSMVRIHFSFGSDPFIIKQLRAELDALDGSIAVIKLFSLGNSIHKVSSHVRPTGTPLYTGQIIVSLVSICFQVSALEAIQECGCVVLCASLCVMEKNDRRKPIFP